ncbi:SDR family oxidoreductase [Donghicola tyrosinivorans]|uniref:NADP-dependent 3-hydroxy acid dehydrogenase YdfG n=1 Tax=Donghicola tyrosinivorans TaxID=1652492 RepID=A0A2T0X4W9_9RHOB|nr:SDR family oxidoreductase [Donghicola tyrosinivorans]PRY93904.1 NADP-dependent 3-hydroxy acid dehydrogenase YdfG [Donghicola tyrosinivorans]
MTDVAGKTVLITGASRGIGAAAARVFADAGANVVLVARNREAVAELAGQIGEQALAVPCDVSRYWEVEAAVQAAVNTFGGLDVVVGNAGIIDPIGAMDAVQPDAWGHLIDVNVKGVFNGFHAALPVMKARGGGSFLTVSSGAAHRPVEGWSAYCASKAAVAMLTRSLDLENRSAGIRAIGLSPGTVATDMQREIKASGVGPVAQLEWSDHIPAEWPAKCLLWMCGPEADPWLGEEISLREAEIRMKVGLV